jgi:hypothetical protein
MKANQDEPMSEPNTDHLAVAFPRRSARSALGRGLLFVAIVWSIAGAFQLLLNGGPWLLDRAVKSEWISDTLVTPRPVQPTDCFAAIQDLPRDAPDALAMIRARMTAYELGFSLGLAAGGRNAGTAGQAVLVQMEEARSRLAAELGVATPALPPVERLANALHEFEVYVTADPQCIGARLAKRYSERHDALFRFGAFAGHSLIYRSLAPELGVIFVPDLRQYGKAAGLPEEAWRPLTESTPGLSGALAQAEAARDDARASAAAAVAELEGCRARLAEAESAQARAMAELQVGQRVLPTAQVVNKA